MYTEVQRQLRIFKNDTQRVDGSRQESQWQNTHIQVHVHVSTRASIHTHAGGRTQIHTRTCVLLYRYHPVRMRTHTRGPAHTQQSFYKPSLTKSFEGAGGSDTEVFGALASKDDLQSWVYKLTYQG